MPCLTMGSPSFLVLFLALASNRFFLLEAYDVMLPEKMCDGQTFMMTTDSSFSNSSEVSGQVFMQEKPSTISSTFILMLRDCCPAPAQKRSRIAFYYNLREFGLQANESMQVWEKQGGDYKLRKVLTSVEVTNKAPRSYDQFRTEYSFRPVVKFVLSLSESSKAGGNRFFQIDWTILSESYQYSTRVCEALNGYVAAKLMCEQDADADRVYCPFEYNGTSANADPVLRRECTPSRQTCESENDVGYLSYFKNAERDQAIFFLALTLESVLCLNLIYCCNRCCRGKKGKDLGAKRRNAIIKASQSPASRATSASPAAQRDDVSLI